MQKDSNQQQKLNNEAKNGYLEIIRLLRDHVL